MAHPKPPASIDNLDSCVGCSSLTKQRFYIISRKGESGPCYKNACEFFSLEFKTGANIGSHYCQFCSRRLNKIFCLRAEEKKLSEEFRKKSRVKQACQAKRKSDSSPDQENDIVKHPKRIKEERKCDQDQLSQSTGDQLSQSTGDQLSQSTSDQLSQSMGDQPSQSLSTETTGHTPPPQVPVPVDGPVGAEEHSKSSSQGYQKLVPKFVWRRKPIISRHAFVSYTSMSTQKKLSHVVQSLTMGSVRKAVKLLLSSVDEAVQAAARKGVADVVRKEGEDAMHSKWLKNNSHKCLVESELHKTIDELERISPTTVSVLHSTATNKLNGPDLVKVFSAHMILLNSRSKFMSGFQQYVGLTMQNNKLGKEGFNVLSRFGLTVCHSSVRKIPPHLQGDIVIAIDRKKKEVKDKKLDTVNILHDHLYAFGRNLLEET